MYFLQKKGKKKKDSVINKLFMPDKHIKFKPTQGARSFKVYLKSDFDY